jgi:para-nitrobenzyl esterase
MGRGDDGGVALAATGAAVVVTFNYRLGVLGWLAHPALTAESERHLSGNYGLLDQLAALRWVRRNIAQFGGDPNHTTIWGFPGSQYVGCMMVSPLARPLSTCDPAERTAIRPEASPSAIVRPAPFRRGIGCQTSTLAGHR